MPSVLIVDDATLMRVSLRILLEKKGFNVIGEAENGAVAIRKYMEIRPDIVTMDITMPVANGIEATRKIKEFDCNAKIVIVSAMGQEVYVREAVMAGADSFIVKPYKEDHVIKVLKSLLG